MMKSGTKFADLPAFMNCPSWRYLVGSCVGGSGSRLFSLGVVWSDVSRGSSSRAMSPAITRSNDNEDKKIHVLD